ncbi:MAG: TIGR03905 family TSCPD domain-containing protein [Eubacteriales bacterium]|nr:TIGR03905 family TSCPD domain-containing protein [Eubacteriales bacterium]
MIYKTKGTCSQAIEFEIDENKVLHNVKFIGGCSGNTQGIAKLVEGMDTDEVIRRLEGINCGGRGTSCPDQLSLALKAALTE